MKCTKLSLLLAGLLAVSSGYAQTTTTPTAPSPSATTTAPSTMKLTKEQAKAEHDRIEEAYKTDKKACDALKDNAKDVCQAEAKAKEKVAKADLKYRESGDQKHAVKLAEVKAETEYDVAKEKCEDLKGAAQSDCKKQAKDVEKAARDAAKKSAKT
ncbi:hypothetical protein HLB44_25265 [Aquincola sp. S2]|uniref:Cell envelope biogenesis protein TolA n=1 Tax=Pseudaquabacterium terrae TaxID=2732868 RepID=A0ABX2ENY0_9BURK|nr:hypothetical protein [Aquabacterium terrae]NRF70323.1 hypothetical protein [Aquabacterium terrae]